MQRLSEPPYMKFPFEVGADGPQISGRSTHVREQIEQVLFTNPGERVFRPAFGAGVRALIFEPNNQSLRELARERLTSSLSDALQGEVDPKTLKVTFPELEPGEEHKLKIVISYTLATIGHSEQQEFELT